MDAAFDDMLSQIVTVYAKAGQSADGHATFSTSGTALKARVVGTGRQFRDSNGNVTAAKSVAWLSSTSLLSARSRYLLPDGGSPPVLLVDTFPDEDGNYYTKVWFG